MKKASIKQAEILCMLFTCLLIISCEKYLELPYNVDYYNQPREGLIQGSDANEELSGENVHGGYGNDIILGTDQNDILDGGNGEDSIKAGAGDDLIISKSDGREARVGRNYTIYRDPQNLIHSTTKTLNPNYPIKANDVLSGGTGKDIFRFITLVMLKASLLKRIKKETET